MKQNVKHTIANNLLINMIHRYPAPEDEAAYAKKIPMRFVEELQRYFPGAFRYKYRGTSVYCDTCSKGDESDWIYDRPREFCHKGWATSFAIYPNNTRINTRWQEYLNWRKDV